MLSVAASNSQAGPRVSVCLPAYNAESTIVATLESVWNQTFEDFEVVVVDDCSTDSTAELLAAQRDPRLRVLRNERNLGAAATFNRALANATAPLIKFHESDDLFYPECIARMVALLDEHPELGMVFSTRDILFDPDDPNQRRWSELYRDLSSQLGELHAVNDGADLFRRWAEVGFHFNCVGEPLVVMLRREVLVRAGGFNPYIRQSQDLDLWARVMPFCQVGFIPDPLGQYRVPTGSSLTRRNFAMRLGWLSELWTVEGLMCHPEAVRAAPQLEDLRRELRQRARHDFRELLRRQVPGRWIRLADFGRMAAWRVRRSVRPAAVPFASFSPSAPGTESGHSTPLPA